MRLRIVRQPRGVVDGTDLSRFVQGLTYDVGTSLGNLLLAERWAEPVTEIERVAPALVFPLTPAQQQPRLLIVEDDDDARTILADSLRHEGYSVVEARDGQEGLAALVKHRPSVVLLDLNMPRMDGGEFRQAQQRLGDPGLSGVPVIVVSAVDDAREQGEKLGAAEVISKPIDMDRLFETIRKQANGRPDASRDSSA